MNVTSQATCDHFCSTKNRAKRKVNSFVSFFQSFSVFFFFLLDACDRVFVFSVPFTFRWALCLARPTGLSATQAYSPACSPLTAGIVRAETLSPNAVIPTPSPTSKWRPSNNHLSEIGVSPFTTAQWTIIRSPELVSSNANGCRCGATAER